MQGLGCRDNVGCGVYGLGVQGLMRIQGFDFGFCAVFAVVAKFSVLASGSLLQIVSERNPEPYILNHKP